jgi:hypothetical protein
VDHAAQRARVQREQPETRTFRRLFRDVTVASASVFVVALLAAYAVAAPTPDLTASVGPVVPQPGASAVVQGRVLQPDGSGLDDARIDVIRSGQIVASAVTGDAGTFRVDLRGGCASYRISLQARVQGSAVETAAGRRLCPGDALPVDARVITHGHFIWVPGPR